MGRLILLQTGHQHDDDELQLAAHSHNEGRRLHVEQHRPHVLHGWQNNAQPGAHHQPWHLTYREYPHCVLVWRNKSHLKRELCHMRGLEYRLGVFFLAQL